MALMNQSFTLHETPLRRMKQPSPKVLTPENQMLRLSEFENMRQSERRYTEGSRKMEWVSIQDDEATQARRFVSQDRFQSTLSRQPIYMSDKVVISTSKRRELFDSARVKYWINH